MNHDTGTINHDPTPPNSFKNKEIPKSNHSSSSDDDVVLIDVKSKIDIERNSPPTIPDTILLDDNVEQLSYGSDNEPPPIPNTPPQPSQVNFSLPHGNDSSDNAELEEDEEIFNENEEHVTIHHEDNRSVTEQMNEKLRLLREKYLRDVQDILQEYGCTTHQDVQDPPIFESMTDKDLENELKKYGFRFTTRSSAISKLIRIWEALNKKSSARNQILGPIDFIRLKSQYYEDILVYNPIPLMSLFREMTNGGVKITLSKLKEILEREGVAFAEDASA
ncbi:hypothetical protein TVAG_459180 [Trichomonas vaginalis G3]|uniref:Structure-specific endonuclease subunit SLX4 n=1 Tax=Trichomonas vaginalis (strain ATCC PRA-98 / G3) TaxID=412133 RepID=A2E6C3_TRIV3|nr:Slx4 endonuclease family [Trichomonas vaginalis G3]EAY11846.1 hypothetical protein TVAG_459180 [Trichomonas vaginalis G3]KAI5534263.1 Slx4 endonuclease family [Trichomonas vaginalis G3]|eukprot:XP_001324069.1 hypothetical protein [Trichomonas vaginalis G3]